MGHPPAPRPFPTLRSLLAPDALLAAVARDYPLDAPRSCALLRASWNDTYLVQTATDRYILRVCAAPPAAAGNTRPYPFNGGGQPVAALEYELALLGHLARHGIGVAAPLPRRDGAFLTPLAAAEGIRQGILFQHAPGTVLSPHPFTSIERSHRTGVALASLHAAAATFDGPAARPPRTLAFYLDEPLAVIAPFLADRPTDLERLRALADRVRARLTPPAGLSPSTGILHGDAFNSNASITESGQITWYDFDLAGPGWPAMDLAGAYGCTQLPSVPATESDARWRAFLAGYRTRRHISTVDLAAIPALLLANRLFGCALPLTRLPVIGRGALGADYLDRQLAALEQTADLLDTPPAGR